MIPCIRSSQLSSTEIHSSSPQPSHGNSADATPRSYSHSSPTVNLTREYAYAVQTSSYGEIRICLENLSCREIEIEQLGDRTHDQYLAQVLRPNRESVEEALQYARPTALTHLVVSYFDQSEKISSLCLLLHQRVKRARNLYASLQNLLSVLSLDSETDSLSSSQCGRVFDLFLELEQLENPFPDPHSNNFHDMRRCFTDLENQLDTRLKHSLSRIRLLRRATTGSSICLIGTTLGVVITSVVIATHAVVALVACPILPACIPFPSKIKKKELSRVAQLDAAQRGTYVLHKDLDTIDRLVVRLHAAVEGNKLLIRLGVARGKDMHSIQEVAKQLKKNYINFEKQLTDLEENLYLCFAAINRARSLLLQEINLHQSQMNEY